MKTSGLVSGFLLAAALLSGQVPSGYQGVYISTGTIDGSEFDKPFHFFVTEKAISLNGRSTEIISIKEDAGNLYIVLDKGIEVIYYRMRDALDVIDVRTKQLVITLHIVRQNAFFLTARPCSITLS